MSHKVVYNNCYGGFGISEEAQKFLGLEVDGYGNNCNLERHDPKLVEMVEKLGKRANTRFSNLKIAVISGDRYRIDEYDGNETVVEPDDEDWTVIKEEKKDEPPPLTSNDIAYMSGASWSSLKHD